MKDAVDVVALHGPAIVEEEAEEQPPGMMEEEEEELPHQAEEQPPAIMEEEEASPQAGGQAATAPSRRAGQKAGRRKARRGQGLLTQGQVQGPLPLTALALDSLLAEAEAQQQPEGAAQSQVCCWPLPVLCSF